MNCHFCKSPALHSCSWPVERFVTVEYQRLKIGDRVRRAIDHTGRPPASVEFLQTIPNGFIAVALLVRNRIKSIQVCVDSPVQVERKVICGQPACEAHLRDVGDGTVYCSDHWHSWQHVGVVSVEGEGARA